MYQKAGFIENSSILNEACEKGDEKALRTLLLNGQKPTSEALFIAVSKSYRKCADLLIAQAFRTLDFEKFNNFLNSKHPDGSKTKTPLIKAVERGNFEVTRLLLDNYANYNKLVDGQSALEIAVNDRKIKLIKLMVSENIDLFLDHENLMDILAGLVKRGDDKILEIFIEAMCYHAGFHELANKKCFENERSLVHIASECGYVKCIELIYCSGGSLAAADKSGDTPLHKACREKNLSAVKFLIESGADVNARNLKQDTPLHVAVNAGDDAIVKYLLKCDGVDKNATNHKGRTPIHKAAKCNNFNLARLLFNAGVEVSKVDKDNCTIMNYPQFHPKPKFEMKIRARLNLENKEKGKLSCRVL